MHPYFDSWSPELKVAALRLFLESVFDVRALRLLSLPSAGLPSLSLAWFTVATIIADNSIT